MLLLDDNRSLGPAASQEPDYYKTYNKNFTKTSVDVSELNVTSLIQELRTGQRYHPPKDASSKTNAARGPTTIEVGQTLGPCGNNCMIQIH